MRDGEPKPEPKPELKLVSATAGGIRLDRNNKIAVPVTKAYKPVGTVEVKFTEKATIKSVKVGATDYTTEITTKFGNDKAIFAEEVLTTFVDLVSKGTEVTVVVAGEDGVEKTFTIQLLVADVVTVDLFHTEESPAAVLDPMADFINIKLSVANSIFHELTADDELTYKLEDGSEFTATYNSNFEGFYAKITKTGVTLNELLNAKVTVTTK